MRLLRRAAIVLTLPIAVIVSTIGACLYLFDRDDPPKLPEFARPRGSEVIIDEHQCGASSSSICDQLVVLRTKGDAAAAETELRVRFDENDWTNGTVDDTPQERRLLAISPNRDLCIQYEYRVDALSPTFLHVLVQRCGCPADDSGNSQRGSWHEYCVLGNRLSERP